MHKLLSAAILGSGMALTMAASADFMSPMPEPQTAGAINYLSAGVGEEQREILRSTARDFNLKVVMALTTGEYIAGVPVTITDLRGNRVLDVVADGPWLFAELPDGSYRVAATHEGRTVQASTRVGGGQKVVHLRF